MPPERIAECGRAAGAPRKHGSYRASGHASAGNLHFMLTPAPLDRGPRAYDTFMGDLVDLIVEKFDGSLKAEHGTGRNIAPFVETEWGPATAHMGRSSSSSIRTASSSPGVVLTDDPGPT